MASHLRSAVAPGYLLLCLILGGSVQGVWGNMLLQLVGVGLIAWAAAAPAEEPLVSPARQLLWIAMLSFAVVAVQLIPLPASVWPNLGGRAGIAEGYRLLGLPTPSLPISLDPYDSLATLLTLIPPIALFCAIVRLKAYRASWLALALLGGAIAGILLGTLQVASAQPELSRWYLYSSTNFGVAVGFFANANHMALLLVISLPFLAALLASVRKRNVQRYSAALAIAAGAALVIIVGIALNQSLAGYGLGVPALVASVLIIMRGGRAAQRLLGAAAVLLVIAGLVALYLSPTGNREFNVSTSVNSRATMTETTLRAARDFLPFGSGLGTFRPVYRLYEDRERITRVQVNHAHNDYAELALELGIPGVVLIILFLAWWAVQSQRAWRLHDVGPYARAASIASAAILVHSIVDFPLRTAAMSAAFSMCLALLIERVPVRGKARLDFRPTRHVVLD
jgi:O-antigen ligase